VHQQHEPQAEHRAVAQHDDHASSNDSGDSGERRRSAPQPAHEREHATDDQPEPDVEAADASHGDRGSSDTVPQTPTTPDDSGDVPHD
jgi:hypothetical protein